jgi:mono/diheme cytochrome c family protein
MKKKTIKTLVLLFAGAFLFSTMTGFRLFQNPWIVPDAFKNKQNTVASNAASIADGKALYGTHCKSCHGAKGLGDGTKAKDLKTEPGDFSKATFQAQTDGSIFYKISEARGKDKSDMPSFKKKISDADDIWNIVNFIRTLKK